MTKRAIVLVPGVSRREQLSARDQLLEAIDFYGEGYTTSISDGEDNDGFNFRTITASSREKDGAQLTLDVYEAFWGDLLPDWSNESPWERFKRGLMLVKYWTFGGLFRAVIGRKWPPGTSWAMLFAGLLLLLWYFIVVTVLAQALADGSSGLPDAVKTLFVDSETGTWVSDKLKNLGALPVVSLIVMIFGIGRIETLANVAAFLKAYLRDDPIHGSQVGLRAKSRKRVVAVLDYIYQKSDTEPQTKYDEVFVVAHSLGGAIAVDALAEYGEDLATTTLFTWGSALGALAQQEPLIEREISKFYTNPTPLSNWVDVVFSSDVMGSKVPVPRIAPEKWSLENYPAIFPPTVAPPTPKGLGLGASILHDGYYRSETAILMLLKPVGDLPQLSGPDDGK